MRLGVKRNDKGYKGRAAPLRIAVWMALALFHLVFFMLLDRSQNPRRRSVAALPPARTLHLIFPRVAEPRVPTPERTPLPRRIDPRREAGSQASKPAISTRVAPSRESFAPNAAIPPPPEPPASAPPGPLLDAEATRRAIRDAARTGQSEWQRERSPETRFDMGRRLGGDGRMTEENLGGGRRRFRQNGGCVESTPTRAAQLDPWSTLPKPNLIGECP